MKALRIAYEQIADKLDNSVVQIALDYPKFEQIKQCYLYELYYFDTIQDKIEQREEEIIQYGIITGDYAPFFIQINDDVFNQIKEYIQNPTEYEEVRWHDDVSRLHAILEIYRHDPKNWDV